MIRCLLCREPFAICAVTYEVEGGEICEACDLTFAEPIRPSLGGAVAFLRRNEETERVVLTIARNAGVML